jgi:hypothetical protein
MPSISSLTTLCVVAACLLQDVSASFLQNPCVMQEIETTPVEDSMVEDIPIFVCELQGADSELVEGGVAGSELAVGIKAEDVEMILAQMEITRLDGVTVFTEGLAIDADKTLFFPEGAVLQFDTPVIISSSTETNGDGRRLHGDRDGTHSVVVVRVLASNTKVQHSAAVLSDKVFGTSGDAINLCERFRSCSYGKLQMEPTNHTLATNGVVEITVATEITRQTTSEEVVNAVKMQLGALVGGSDVSIKESFRHVIMCVPTGTVLGGNPRW